MVLSIHRPVHNWKVESIYIMLYVIQIKLLRLRKKIIKIMMFFILKALMGVTHSLLKKCLNNIVKNRKYYNRNSRN